MYTQWVWMVRQDISAHVVSDTLPFIKSFGPLSSTILGCQSPTGGGGISQFFGLLCHACLLDGRRKPHPQQQQLAATPLSPLLWDLKGPPAYWKKHMAHPPPLAEGNGCHICLNFKWWFHWLECRCRWSPLEKILLNVFNFFLQTSTTEAWTWRCESPLGVQTCVVPVCKKPFKGKVLLKCFFLSRDPSYLHSKWQICLLECRHAQYPPAKKIFKGKVPLNHQNFPRGNVSDVMTSLLCDIMSRYPCPYRNAPQIPPLGRRQDWGTLSPSDSLLVVHVHLHHKVPPWWDDNSNFSFPVMWH